MSKTIGVIGSRQRDSEEDFQLVEKAFLKVYEEGDTICSGLCPQGGDRFAVILANKMKLGHNKRLWFPAKWDDITVPGAVIKYNKWSKPYNVLAGFMRNTHIARESDILIACVSESRRGGTEDTITKWKNFHKEKDPIIV